MTLTSTTDGPLPAAEHPAIDVACERIAPTWPLDRFIAVNPYWGWRALPAPTVSAVLGTLAGTSLTMPRGWFRGEWAAGRLADHHLDAAAEAMGDPSLADAARLALHDDGTPAVRRVPLLTDLRDGVDAPRPGQTWVDLVAHQIGQHCAAHVDHCQAAWHDDDHEGLFAGWRTQPTTWHAVHWRNGSAWVRERLASLPDRPAAAIELMLDDMAVPAAGRESYLTALLLSVNGWAAWFAYERWQARLVGGDDHTIVDLLAIRLAFDWLLHDDVPHHERTALLAGWHDAWARSGHLGALLAAEQRVDWVLQEAVERTYQDGLVAGLRAATPATPTPTAVDAVFCIDVRSEVFRRALEAQSPAVRTRGFAGFFGLPIAYTPAGSTSARPQLPGLLAPGLAVDEVADTPAATLAAADERAAAHGRRVRWSRFKSAPSSVFTFVESIGLTYGVKLVKDTLGRGHGSSRWEHADLSRTTAQHVRPHLAMVHDDPAAAAQIGRRVLTGMGMLDGFAPLVLLCGHGSRTTNNPLAAGLDCGACGGQTGEVNARVLAQLLNAAPVREQLAALGVTIPSTTCFVAGLHETTTDHVHLFDTDDVPATHTAAVAELQAWLAAAGDAARAERAPSLGLGHLVGRPAELEQAVGRRADDWSQVRPEWGLAGNAAFVVAPRWRTAQLDLGGRSFLHEYDHRLDPDLSVLTLIMTAPMVVTNWINLQYHASTVDNRRYGSGNKVLHNVVGGHVGVFEGNGGDLRIGLPLQSLHDGTTLRHAPLRLTVAIEAPREAIDSIVAAHEVVAQLVGNGWLHLLRIEPTTGDVERWTHDGWTPA